MIIKIKIIYPANFYSQFFSSKVQNSWGSVNIQQIKIPTQMDNG